MDWPDPMTLGVLLYPRFGLLDVCLPLGAFGALKNVFESVLLAEEAGEVESGQGARLMADEAYGKSGKLDLLLVPGGIGARQQVENEALLRWIGERAATARITMSVGTGAALLARAGVLDERRATATKRGLDWVREQGPRAHWEPVGRWVDDGAVVTASGPAAGLDMALHVITRLTAPDVGENVARSLEHAWEKDARRDPFARPS